MRSPKQKLTCGLAAMILIFTLISCGTFPSPSTPPSGDSNQQTTPLSTNADGQPIPSDPSNPAQIKHTVTFDYNDGSGQKVDVQIPHGSKIDAYIPELSFADREVTAWSSLREGAHYAAAITDSLTLYAQWITFTPVIYTDSVPATVNDRFVEIHASGDPSLLAGKILRIGTKVQRLSIIADGSIYHDFSIIINERSNDVSILFDNFSYTSTQSIGLMGDGSSGYNVNLTIENACRIDCSGSYAQEGAQGLHAIDVPRLHVNGSGSLTLLAGHGGNGQNMPNAAGGHHGDTGGQAGNGGHGIVADRVYISDVSLIVQAGHGGNGGSGGKGTNDFPTIRRNGGNGGSGGNGGDAIHTDSVESINASLNLTAGNGGNGGNGGQSGGFSAAAGKGGNGGNGGNGGHIYNANADVSISGCTTNYTPGTGGAGGTGGDSDGSLNTNDGAGGGHGTSGDVNDN